MSLAGRGQLHSDSWGIMITADISSKPTINLCEQVKLHVTHCAEVLKGARPTRPGPGWWRASWRLPPAPPAAGVDTGTMLTFQPLAGSCRPVATAPRGHPHRPQPLFPGPGPL